MLSRLRNLARLLLAIGTGIVKLTLGKGSRSGGSRGPLVEITIFRCGMLSAGMMTDGDAR